ncbi:TonB-dependent receptor [Halopseudomonas yangmingensis]|uniref:Hemoglobin/transferrin/lactoferrin receptor protein n=1 Tax=Halopseudomonas yangmingensis TaxID=1720063 RepID=A0A1I4SHA1_9GAMM|nr:TonB-dependent receptor [Halopseudomonas yangmingensis]SFM63711.1 hemoglobin/transferrin/lactoferrin receptor protein [Halopseudomonas yangmingensis]
MFIRHPLSKALLALLATPLAASAAVQLPATTVTAKGYQADAMRTPGASLVLTPEQAEPGATVGSLLRGQPGLAVQSDGAWGQNPVLRGLSKESIVLLVDGNRLNSAQPQGAIASLVELGLLERVEVVKGPGSVLHGSGALGGVVNLLTPEPDFNHQGQLEGRVAAGWSSVDRGRQAAALLQTGNDRQALVLGAALRRLEDYKGADGRVADTGYDSQSLLFKYALRVSEQGRIKLNLQRDDAEDVWYPGSAKPAPAALGGTLTIHSPNQQRTLYALGYEDQLGAGRFNAEVYRQEVYREIRAWNTGRQRNQVWNDVTFSTDGLRSSYRLPVGERHLLSVGVDHWEMTGDPERYQFQGPSNTVLRSDPFSKGEVRSSGLFVQDDIQLDQLAVQLGARWDRVRGTADSKGSGAQQVTSGLSNSSSNLSWSAGAIYNLQPLLNPYVTLGSAYRAPDLRERFEDAERGDGYFHRGNPQLDAEKSTSLELGLKGDDGLFSYQLAMHWTRIDDYIAGRVTGQTNQQGVPIKVTENLDRVVIRGLEGMAAQRFGSYLADVRLTWLEGDNRQDREPLYRMPAPELTLGLGQPAEQGFNWRTQLRAVKAQNRVAKTFANGTEDATSGFATVDLSLGWGFGATAGFKRVDTQLTLRNLFDRGYHEHLVEGISGQEIQSPGRGLSLNLRGEF